MLAIPELKTGEKCDFWDVWQAHDLNTVRAMIEKAHAPDPQLDTINQQLNQIRDRQNELDKKLGSANSSLNDSPDDDLDSLLISDFPEFEESHYYGLAGDLAALAVQDSEASKVGVYLSFLVMAAALLGRDKYIRIGETKHHARLFSVLVGASAKARKGTSFKPVERILKEAENMMIYAKHSCLAVRDGGLSSAEGLAWQVRDEAENTDKNGVPLHEGITDKRLLIVEEELGNVFKQCQRDGNALSPTLRRLWDGGTLAPMTKNNQVTATNPHINVLGHITQFELKCLLTSSDTHNGLANRFLWCCVRRSQKLAFPKPMNDDRLKGLAGQLARAISQSNIETELQLTDNAKTFWSKKYHEISLDRMGVIGSVTSRSEPYVMRLSVLFALLDCTDTIDTHHIQAACHVVEFCNQSAEYIFTSHSESATGSDAEKLLNALAEKPMTQTEISSLFNRNKKRHELIAMFKELQSMNKIEKCTIQTARKKVDGWMLKK